MYREIILPNLGFGMEEGRISSWLCSIGQTVLKGDAVAEVEGDKATVELEALADGVIAEILVAAGETVPVGTVLGRIRLDSETAEVSSSESTSAAAAPLSQVDAEPPRETPRLTPVARRVADHRGVAPEALNAIKGSGPSGRIMRGDIESAVVPAAQRGKPLAAPAIRKLASTYGLDLQGIRPGGSFGQVTRDDIERARAEAQIETPSVRNREVGRIEVDLSPMRKTIAKRLSQSAQQSPHFYTTSLLDLTHAISLLPEGIGLNALVLFLTVSALQDVPQLNATFENGHLYQYQNVHLSVAVAVEDGLLTPVISHADHLSLSGMAAKSKAVIKRAREGKLMTEDIGSGTFTVSNLGVIDQVERFTAIINPPQIGILAVGAIKERAHVINGGLHIRRSAYVTLCADHRFIDGMTAARFLQALEQRTHSFSHLGE